MVEVHILTTEAADVAVRLVNTLAVVGGTRITLALVDVCNNTGQSTT